MKEKGFIPLTLVIIVFLLSIAGAFYLGWSFKNSAPASIPEPTRQKSLPTNTPIPSQTTQPTAKPTLSKSTSVTTFTSDTATYFRNLFPKELPVYPGAKMDDYNNQGSCKAELLKNNPNCLQVMFTFKAKIDSISVENVVNWYVNNPVPGWTYRGVYGDQRGYQFGDIYKNTKDVYYRMIYRYTGPEKNEVAIDYNGPYPYSDLSPKP